MATLKKRKCTSWKTPAALHQKRKGKKTWPGQTVCLQNRKRSHLIEKTGTTNTSKKFIWYCCQWCLHARFQDLGVVLPHQNLHASHSCHFPWEQQQSLPSDVLFVIFIHAPRHNVDMPQRSQTSEQMQPQKQVPEVNKLCLPDLSWESAWRQLQVEHPEDLNDPPALLV